jgi:hypothetical protein
MTQLILKPANASRSSGQWSDEDYDVIADGKVVGRIYEDAHLQHAARHALVLVDHRDRAGAGRGDAGLSLLAGHDGNRV